MPFSHFGLHADLQRSLGTLGFERSGHARDAFVGIFRTRDTEHGIAPAPALQVPYEALLRADEAGEAHDDERHQQETDLQFEQRESGRATA